MCCLSATETISSPWQTLDPGSKLHFVALAPLFPAVHASALLSTTKDPHFPLGIPSLQLTWQRSLQKGMNLSGTSPQVPSWRKGTFSVFHVFGRALPLIARARLSCCSAKATQRSCDEHRPAEVQQGPQALGHGGSVPG